MRPAAGSDGSGRERRQAGRVAGQWRCAQCPAKGEGGSSGLEQHYFAAHADGAGVGSDVVAGSRAVSEGSTASTAGAGSAEAEAVKRPADPSLW